MSEPVVTQADRVAAARWAKANSRHQQAANIKRGSCDTAPIVQAFARHRTAETEALRAEVARLREALAMAVAEMARASGRLEVIAGCNEDRRIAAALMGSCDFARAALGDER